MQTEIIGKTNSSYWTFKIIVTEGTNENNDNTITIESFLGRTSTAGASYFMGSYKLTFNCDEQTNSQELYKNSGNIPAGGWYSLGSHTFVVDKENINVSGSMSTTSFNPSSASASGSVTLIDIGKLNIGVSGVWKKANVYIGKNGVWKKCKPYFGVSGVWKKGK
jgi:hypothetical protein